MKIILDTKAIERLIGGDSELELELRNSIVQEFTKKHLKGVINEKTVSELRHELTKYANNLIKEQFGIDANCRLPLNYKIPENIKKVILEIIDKAFYTMIQDKIDDLNKKVNSKFDYIEAEVDRLVNKRIDSKVNEIIDAKVKEKFEKIMKKL